MRENLDKKLTPNDIGRVLFVGTVRLGGEQPGDDDPLFAVAGFDPVSVQRKTEQVARRELREFEDTTRSRIDSEDFHFGVSAYKYPGDLQSLADSLGLDQEHIDEIFEEGVTGF